MPGSNLIYLFGRNADLVAKLSQKGARFVIVGGVAVRHYIPTREADDLDLLIDPTERNAQIVIDAVNSGGSQFFSVPPLELAKPKRLWPVKSDYYVDFITPRDAAEFEAIWLTTEEAMVARSPLNIPVRVSSIEKLIEMIDGSENRKHITDAESLRELLRQV